LCSDTFTAFDKDPDLKKLQNEKEIKEITEKLKKIVIPEFADVLRNTVPTPEVLLKNLHTRGINIRHLGRVRKHLLRKMMTQNSTDVDVSVYSLKDYWIKFFKPPKNKPESNFN